jgi:hypothetical protein
MLAGLNRCMPLAQRGLATQIGSPRSSLSVAGETGRGAVTPRCGSAGRASCRPGMGVRRRRKHLFMGANCEDDAKDLVRALSGEVRADAETAFRVRRVSYSYMLIDPSSC